MTDITPNDIVNKEFRVTMRGYAREQVDEFLQQVSDALYKTLGENQRLRGQLDELRGKVEQNKQSEELLKSALLLAERAADETRQRAHQEADLIRREATDAVQTEYAKLESTRQSRLRLLVELRAMLNAHLSLLDSQEATSGSSQREGATG
ncbi:MAG TPA: DivIVA domain-containing protein [Armatimonadota bacterium]|jgi:cell division initiation protein